MDAVSMCKPFQEMLRRRYLVMLSVLSILRLPISFPFSVAASSGSNVEIAWCKVHR